MADNDFTLPKDLYSEIEGMDCISQNNNEAIEALSKAIARLTDDDVIKVMAKQIALLALDTMNTVNVAAETLGANFKELS